ncbi:MAG TPA: CBS domain-containing protein [Pseudolabrys sp.]|nr:CBS domain-containing protein [Pseudolabrys sp.]
MKAKDIMTRTVVSVDPDATVLQAARLMLQHHISGLPVVDRAGRLVGVLSEGDFLRRGETHTERRRSRWLEFLMGPGRMAADYVHSHGSKVSEVMTPDVKTVSDDASLEDIVALMEKHRIKRVPVLRAGKLVGIVTRSNLMHAMVSIARFSTPGAYSDAAIRDKLLAEIRKQQWAPVATADVVVHDGVVDLWGMIVDERQRAALKVAAENIPGVAAVKDHLVWIEPMTGVVVEPPPEQAAQPPRAPVVAAWPRPSH